MIAGAIHPMHGMNPIPQATMLKRKVPKPAAAAGCRSQFKDSPSLSPSWGSADTVWITLCARDGGSSTVTAYPTNYTGNNSTRAAGGGSGASYGIATRNNATATEDPPSFTVAASGAWCANTIAIRPSAASNTTITVPTGPWR